MAADTSPSQKPANFKFILNAKKYPKGKDTHQYAKKFANKTIFVCLIPLQIPDNEICNPSKI